MKKNWKFQVKVHLKWRPAIYVALTLILIMAAIFVILRQKPKAETVNTVVLQESFEPSASRSSTIVGQINNAVLSAQQDTESISGSYVLAVNNQPRSLAYSTSTCNAFLNQPLTALTAKKTYNFDVALRGTISGSSVVIRLNWKEKSFLTTTSKYYDKVILPADIDQNNWTIIHFSYLMSNSLVAGSAYIEVIRECSPNMFIGQIDSVTVTNALVGTVQSNMDSSIKLFDKTTINIKPQIDKPMQSLQAKGEGKISSVDSFIRVVLTDINGKEYQVYENSGVINPVGTFTFDKIGEETKLLGNITPSSLAIYSTNCTWNIKSVRVVINEDRLESAILTRLQSASDKEATRTAIQAEIKKTFDDQRLAKYQTWATNSNLKDLVLTETTMSKATYEQKKQFYGGVVPNLQGFEFYSGGIFKIASSDASAYEKLSTTLTLPKTWDWRNRHNANWLTPVKSQGGCNSCSNFAAIGVIESVAKLYFNDPNLNIDLSEQFAMCKANGAWSNAGGCDGWGNNPVKTLELALSTTIPYENAMPYQTSSSPEFCQIPWGSGGPPSGGWRIGHWYGWLVGVSNNDLKKSIINHGPMTVVIPSWLHAMVLVGWGYDSNNDPYYIMKNSHGYWYGNNDTNPWTGNGYVSLILPKTDRMMTYYADNPVPMNTEQGRTIKCVDKDHDTYYNWGISPTKPSTCPADAKAQKDCNDADNHVGPYDTNYNCTSIPAGTNYGIEDLTNSYFPGSPLTSARSYQFNWNIRLPSSSTVNWEIRNTAGRVIRSDTKTYTKPANLYTWYGQTQTWCGKDNNGNMMPAGQYTFSVWTGTYPKKTTTFSYTSGSCP